MHANTRQVIAAAKNNSADLSEVQIPASQTLKQYFVYASNWPPDSHAWTKSVSSKWFEGVNEALLRAVQSTWSTYPSSHEHIRQLYEVSRMCFAVHKFRDASQTVAFVVPICNDLDVWNAWPMLRDLRFCPPLPVAVVRDLQAQHILAINQANILAINQARDAEMATFLRNQATAVANNTWTQNYWDNRAWSNRW